jgi:predicted transcriptional regulator
VGKDGRGNKMSLTAVEAQYTNETAAASPEILEDPLTSSTVLIPNDQHRHVPPKSSLVKSTKTDYALKVYVTEERMWLAICGHPKDFTKVFETEFALLSIIAAHGEGGILQGDLVKESGQDKRSVPKRTDLLRDKGYIEKRNVQLRGSKTSRLIFRRFQSSGVNELITPMPVWVGPDGRAENEAVDFHFLVQNLFSVLKEKQIITRDDLKKELEMTTKWRARVLAKAVRKLEHIGCLSRVKAASEASRKVRLYFFCIKLIHEPSEKDLEAFFAPATNLLDEHVFEEQDLEEEDEAEHMMAEPTMRVEGNQLQEIGRVVPQWNPDRSLPNALHNLVHDAGTQGLTNKVCDLCH